MKNQPRIIIIFFKKKKGKEKIIYSLLFVGKKRQLHQQNPEWLHGFSS